MSRPRSHWGSRLGFVLAASGCAVGLGNLWRFPYIVGENGGGLFVLLYLGCIAFVGLPILMAEILAGRAGEGSAVTALRRLAGKGSPWIGLGWLGVVASAAVLTVYAVAAGWSMHFTVLSARGVLSGMPTAEVPELFADLYANGTWNVSWGLLFIAVTATVVAAGVQSGLERWSRILMPLLFVMLLILLVYSVRLDGFGEALVFVFGLHADKLSAAGVLEALGHSFFTLGVGVGAMLTYGSYLGGDADIARDSVTIAFLDTMVALLACLVLFPTTFTYGLTPGEGPGLVFVNLPIAFAQMPAGGFLATLFFSLLAFAALTSSLAMLEVPVAYMVDELGWKRRRATWALAAAIAVVMVPAALSGGTHVFGAGFAAVLGKNWFDLVLDTISNWVMPLGGLLYAIYVGWRLPETIRRAQFPEGMSAGLYRGWLRVLRFFVPAAMVAVFLHAVGIF